MEQFLGHGGEPLTQGGHLSGDVVRPCGQGQFGVLGGQPAETRGNGDSTREHQLEAPSNLELLDVLGEIPRCHAPVDVLVSR